MGNVAGHLVECLCKQMAQVVGEDLGGLHACFFCQCLQVRPDLKPRQRIPGAVPEDRTGLQVLGADIVPQPGAQLAGQENRADLPLVADLRHPGANRFHGDEPHLGDPDPGGGDGFQQIPHMLLWIQSRGILQSFVLFLAQIPARMAEACRLHPEQAEYAVVHSLEPQQPVDGADFGVHGGGSQSGIRQGLLPLNQEFLADGAVPGPEDKTCGVGGILADGGVTALLSLEELHIEIQVLPGKGLVVDCHDDVLPVFCSVSFLLYPGPALFIRSFRTPETRSSRNPSRNEGGLAEREQFMVLTWKTEVSGLGV